MPRRFATLMYHELSRAGHPLCESDRGYAKYAVDERQFARQMERLVADGMVGVTVGQAVAAERSEAQLVAISFDDGCATDLTIAAPILSKAGFGATSYVTTGFLGRRGFLTPEQLRQLAVAGFEIGSHSVTHRFLPDLSDTELTRELSESRDTLEQIVARPVTHFSCPGGRFDARVVDAVRRAGYRTMATSRIGIHAAGDDLFRLPRIVVTESASTDYVAAVARGRGFLSHRLRGAVLDAAKLVLGNRLYVALRARALGDRSPGYDRSR